jgi:hypothetical protein
MVAGWQTPTQPLANLDQVAESILELEAPSDAGGLIS